MSADAPKSVDPQLMSFIQEQTSMAAFQGMVHNLTESCWELCMPGAPAAKMDGKTETCLKNCVNRFIDGSQFIIQRMQQVQAAKMQQTKGFQ